MANKGVLYIISAPSGAGKTSLVNALLKVVPGLHVSISHTTRGIRPNETDGINYHFVSEEKFQGMLAKKQFLESAKVFGNYYGTSKEFVEERILKGEDVILEIDWQGARQVRKLFTNVISIFILPPSLEELKSRLETRHKESEDVIQNRMLNAKSEIKHFNEYDYLVLNDNFDKALLDISSIIAVERLRLAKQKIYYHKLLIDLTE